MRPFRYRARSRAGESVDGVVQGESSAAVARGLVAQGLFPTHVVDLGRRDDLLTRLRMGWSGSGRTPARAFGSQDLALFTRRLADLLEAGVPMQRAMAQLHLQTRDKRLRGVLESVSRRVRAGESLSAALLGQGGAFPRSLIGAVEAGETGGGLVSILHGLAELYEKEDDLRRSVRAALLYPALVLLVSIATVALMFLHLLPQLRVLYEDMGQALPGPTRVLLGLATWTEHHRALAIGLLIAFGVATAIAHARSRRLRRWCDHAVLRAPVLGRIVRHREIVRFAHTLSSLVAGGVPLVRGLWFASRGAGNLVVADEVRAFGQRVGEGASLSEVVADSRLGDAVLVMMIEVGEQRGRLSESLDRACRVHERELRDTMGTITTVLEPLLIVAIGLVVGFIVFSMMLPIMELDLG